MFMAGNTEDRILIMDRRSDKPQDHPNASTIEIISAKSFGKIFTPAMTSVPAKFISIINSEIDTFPSNLQDIQTLERLELRNNKLRVSLPTWLGNFSNMRELILRNNGIANVPASVGNLPLLQSLDLSINMIVNMPASLRNLPPQTNIRVDGNPLVTYYPFTKTQLMNMWGDKPSSHLPPEIQATADACSKRDDAACTALAEFYRDSLDEIVDRVVRDGKATNRDVIRFCHELIYFPETRMRIKAMNAEILKTMQDACL